MAAVQKFVLISLILCCTINVGFCENNILDNLVEDTDVAEGRTFGHHFLKRISFAILPAAFVVGVITTLLAALTVVSLKGLGVGVVLLILAVGQLLSRTIIPHAAAHAHTYPAPLPSPIYSHSSSISSPVWVEKTW